MKGRSSSTPSKPVLDIKAFQRLLSAAYMLQQHSEGKADCAAIPKGIVKNLRPVLEVPRTLEPAVSQSVRPLAASRRLAHTEVEALKLKYDSLINTDLIPQGDGLPAFCPRVPPGRSAVATRNPGCFQAESVAGQAGGPGGTSRRTAAHQITQKLGHDLNTRSSDSVVEHEVLKHRSRKGINSA